MTTSWTKASVCTSVFALIAGLSYGAAPDARAATPPYATASRYVSSLTQQQLDDKGCLLGNNIEAEAGTQNVVVILDFGGQRNDSTSGWMFSRWGGNDVTDTWARDAVKSFAHGFWLCSGTDTASQLSLGLGTNNSLTVSAAAGQVVANRVDEAANYADNNFYGQVHVIGADDFESTFGGPAAAQNWVDGYNNANTRSMYNYGSADGCSSTGVASACANGWGSSDYYYVSWFGPNWPLPEIYNEAGTNAKQWKYLSLWAYQNKGTAMKFIGSMAQHRACGTGCPGTNNTANQAWNQLYDALASNANTAPGATGMKSTDIGWN